MTLVSVSWGEDIYIYDKDRKKNVNKICFEVENVWMCLKI